MNFSFFTVFLKNRNIISKIKRSKVTDYAALSKCLQLYSGAVDLISDQSLSLVQFFVHASSKCSPPPPFQVSFQKQKNMFKLKHKELQSNLS